ncbi:MAG TPA: PKD domain-containing protein [Bacteroidales bacterium]|nr:PKD domain-containing protein [Bacteroidales bacterium]
MKKLFIILALLLVSGIVPIVAQQNSNLSYAYDKLAEREEFYFSFTCESLPLLMELTQKISLDNVKGSTVYAYANPVEFEEFLAYNIEFEPVWDYYNTPKAITMATTVAQMANWDRYPTYDVYLQMMNNFVTNYPNLCRLETIGNSVNGKSIVCLVISDNVNTDEDEPEFFWTGTIHGDETTGWIMTMRLADYLLSNYGTNTQATNLVNEMEIYINPLSNPDGTYYGSSSYTSIVNGRRYNANNYDLNRNFPTVNGTSYTLQPEINIMMTYATDHDFVMSANTHGGAEVVNYPWDAWRSDERPPVDQNWWEFVSSVYVDNVFAVSPSNYFTDLYADGITEGGDWYKISGGRQDYMNWYHNCREVTLEISDTKMLGVESLNAYWGYNRQAMLDYTQQALYGFRGIVTDACTGTALSDVKVEISGHDADHSEVYSSAPVGNYHRPIYAGTYNVTFSKTGYTSKTLPVTVTNNNSTRLDVQLVPTSVATPAFTATPTSVPIGGTAAFTDQTSGTVTSRNWTFEQGTPGTATTQNPTVTYNTVGLFDATLQIVSAGCTLSLTKPNYINVYTPGAPTPGFTCDVTSTCIGIVSFTNTSTDATSYLWNFGDGTTSTEVNPVHTYTIDGVYTVSLTATNAYGNNILTQNNLITVDLPEAPTTTSAQNCGPASLTLNAAGNGTLEWYDAATNGNLITTGTSYTNNFTNSTTYYVQSGRSPHTYYVGNTDSNTNGGNHTNNAYYLIFTAISDFRLVSVEVNAGTTAGNRIIQLRNSAGTVLQSVTANLPTGISRVTLNFDIPAGEDYQLRCGTTNPNLYRNNAGVSYPYTVDGVVSITGTNANQTVYYYFYDWEVLVGDECISARTPVSAIINEVPNAPTVTGGGTFCANSAILTASGAGDHNMYFQGTDANGTSTANETSSYEATASGTYYFRVQTGSGCWGPSAGATVTLNTLPAAVSVSGGGTQCGGTMTLTATGGTGGTIYWQGTTSGGTNTATPSASQTVSASGTYYFRARSSGGCWGPEGSATVTINPAPTAVSVSGGGSFCGGSATLTATGGTGGTIYYQGTTSGGTSTATPSSSQTVSSSGTYYFRARNTDGCWGTEGSATVTINTVPTAVSVSGGGTQCGGTMTLTATGGSGGTIYWQGTTSGGTSTATASSSQTVSSSGTYYFRARSSLGCWGPEGSATVTINSVPAAVTVSGGGLYCGTNPTLTASGGAGGTIYWQNTTTNGTSTATASSSQTVSSSGTYYFRAQSAAGCWGAQGSATVSVNPAVSVNLSMTEESAPGAQDGTATASVTGGTSPFNYTWTSPASGNPATGLAAGYYCLTVQDNVGCTATDCITITLANQPNPPTAQFTADQVSGCGSLAVQFTDQSTNNPTSWQWQFGDGANSTEQNPLHLYTAAGQYTVTLTVSNADGSDDLEMTNYITVWPTLIVNLSMTQESAEGAADGTVTASVDGGTAPFQFIWSVAGSGSVLTGLTAGEYCVTVNDNNECNDANCITLTVAGSNPLDALFTAQQEGTCGSATVTFTDNSTGGATQWLWSFGDGAESNEQNPQHFYATHGVYQVTLQIGDGQYTDSYSINITVFEQPQLSFEVTNVSEEGAADGAIQLIITGGAMPYIINWSNGQHTPFISGLTQGMYSVGVIDNNGCFATGATTVGVEVGIGTESGSVLSLYPNPAHEAITLTSDRPLGDIAITDALGRVCQRINANTETITLSISDLPAGLYMLRCTRGDDSRILKFVKTE